MNLGLSTVCAARGLFGADVRRRPEVRRAMERHVKLNPACTWCGTTKGPEAHHIIPVHVDPSGAADPANLRTFCRRCHFTVGHGNDWLKYVIPLPDPRPVLP